ncbi:MAG: nucleotidyltransferase family protein [Actinomycetota bacterium]|nr:nucleotidyltransferase family protein [Actinomycetota bacterium]
MTERKSRAAGNDDPGRAERFQSVLSEAIAVADQNDFPYVVAGSIASVSWGRPGSFGDIDFLIDRQDAKAWLKALEAAGFETEETFPQWLFKAFKLGITVDVIFEMAGPLYLEPQMLERASMVEIEGTKLRLMSPEDFVVCQALSLKEDTPVYWFNAMGVISRRQIDWDYIVDMSPRGPRKLLSFLLLAQSEDLPVPDSVIRRIFDATFAT